MSGKKKLFAALMCLLLLCALRLAAIAEEGVETVNNVAYIEYAWNGTERTSETKFCTTAIKLSGREETLNEGWYVAEGDVSFSSRPTVSGDVRLILRDDCDLKAEKGITVNEGTAEDGKANSLTIYGQHRNTGTLTVPNTIGVSKDDAGIGGTEGKDSGEITIHGGRVNTTINKAAAAIGGGHNASGTVTIYGGTVTAENGAEPQFKGAAIGGGGSGSGTVTIYGGEITAITNGGGAAIGDGYEGSDSGTVTINGGEITATANGDGAAIGGGYSGSGTVTTINGGEITATATASGDGAAIGGGKYGNATVTINGGKITAKARRDGAAIGGGSGGCGTVTINGGKVEARNDGTGAAIGGGSSRTVTVTINGGEITAKAEGEGAGIGNDFVGSEIFLGWTDAVNDSIKSNKYAGKVTLKKYFKDDDEHEYEAGVVSDNDALAHKKLMPWSVGNTVTVAPAEHGEVSAIPENESANKPVTLTLTPEKGYAPYSLTYTPEGGTAQDISFTWNDNGTYTGRFQMPDKNVTVSAVFAEIMNNVSYIEYAWNGSERTSETKTCEAAIKLSSEMTVLTGGDTAATAGWYAVSGPVTLSARPEVRGYVNLILMDGCKLTASNGIEIADADSSLSIYAQREGEGMGVLEANVYEDSDESGIAAIGGDDEGDGTVTIHGGKISASIANNAGQSNYYCHGAAIGGGYEGNGTVTIYGGTVDATTKGYGAAIGSGTRGNGTVNIYGGTIKAETYEGRSGAAIGSGTEGSSEVTINGGTVEAETGGFGAAIGGGTEGSSEVTINGGTVEAETGGFGAAVGGGSEGSSEVTINGGKITATASRDGAAIGGGWNGNGTVTINGGSVTASALQGSQSAAIGGGFIDERCSTTVDVTVTINGGSVTTSTYGAGGANIGGGFIDENCSTTVDVTVTINGGSVTAHKIDDSVTGSSIGDGWKRSGSKISLSWTNADDSIKTDRYNGTVTLVKNFMDEYGDLYKAGEVSNNDTLRNIILMPGPVGYTVNVASTEHGKVSADPDYAYETKNIILTLTPDEGYVPYSLTYREGDTAQHISFTRNDDGTYMGSFQMPAADVTVSAVFVLAATPPVISEGPQDLSLVYGYAVGSRFSVTASAAEGHTISSYQWYTCSNTEKEDRQPIEGATGAAYDIPGGKGAGTAVYFCAVTATRADNGQTATAESRAATLTISKASATVTADAKVKIAGREDPALTAKVEGLIDGDKLEYTLMREAGEEEGRYAITVTADPDRNPNYEVTAKAGTFTIVAPFSGNFILPAETKTIGKSAFEGLPEITGVDASQCTSLGEHAFRDCRGLLQIRVSKDCDIDDTAFEGCEALIAIYGPGGGLAEKKAEELHILFADESGD